MSSSRSDNTKYHKRYETY